MKSTRKRLSLFLLTALFIAFNSCIGLSMDIHMNKDGSGRIVMEYRISRIAETLGRFEGNENWPVIPAGKADFERTVNRNPGLKLVSFTKKDNPKETVINVTLEYAGTEALLKFLDPSGKKTALIKEAQSQKLTLILNEPLTTPFNEDLINLMRDAAADCSFSINFTSPGNSKLTLTDGKGSPMPPPAAATVTPSGKKVSFSIPVTEAIAITEGLGLIISW